MNTTSSLPPLDGKAPAGHYAPQVDATPRLPASGERALVLGGGGSTGNAWLIGVLAGLAEAGLDVTTADRTVGTSAGSTAAAQISGESPGELFAASLVAPSSPGRAPAGPGARPANRPTVDHLGRTDAIIADAATAADMRRGIGAAAIEMAQAAGDAGQERWRATVAGRLASRQWPDRTVLVTAVDAETGAPVVFDRASGVDLVDAVAASCSGFAAYRIGGRWYVDGGYRRNENADLAAGCRRVLVLSPFGGRTRMPLAWGMQLAAQVDELRAAGARVETVFPDESAEQLFGANAMDLSLRPAAARAGHDQGLALAEPLAEVWR